MKNSTNHTFLIDIKLGANMTIWLVLILALLTNSFARAQDVPVVFDQVVNSVVEIKALYIVTSGTDDKQTSIVQSQGSGVLISKDGKVVTVAHLVQSADSITVQTGIESGISAKVIASEPAADIALLQLERMPADISPAKMGNSDDVKTGQQAFIVGAPYGLHKTITVGYISGRHHPKPPFGPFQPNEMFQTDSGMHHGSSGAPLFNMDGKIIGIATQIVTKNGTYEGMGFAVTAKTVKTLLLDQRSFWTGLEGYWLSGGVAQALNLPQASGLLVQRVASHSPASKLVLQAGTAPSSVGDEKFILGGDIILSIQGVSLAEDHGYEHAHKVLATLKNGAVLSVTVLRAGKQISLSAPVSHWIN